jgi:hypothetical protein
LAVAVVVKTIQPLIAVVRVVEVARVKRVVLPTLEVLVQLIKVKMVVLALQRLLVNPVLIDPAAAVAVPVELVFRVYLVVVVVFLVRVV